MVIFALLGITNLSFFVYAGGGAAVWFSWDSCDKESEFAVILCLHGEADWRLLVVQMLYDAINVSAIQDDESVANVAFPGL